MKKVISMALVLILCLSLCACGEGNDTPETTEAPAKATTVHTEDRIIPPTVEKPATEATQPTQPTEKDVESLYTPYVGKWVCSDEYYVIVNEDGTVIYNDVEYTPEYFEMGDGVAVHLENAEYTYYAGMDENGEVYITAKGCVFVWGLTERFGEGVMVGNHDGRRYILQETEGGNTEPTQEPTTAPTEEPSTSVVCSHTYTDATCTEARTCTKCGARDGYAMGHHWDTTSCTELKTCTRCGATESAVADHSWNPATCEAPKTCSVCGTTEGDAIGHLWKDVTCSAPKTCTVCGATVGYAVGHVDNNGTCSVCGATRKVKENTAKVWNYLKENYGKNLTAQDVADALGLEKRSVDGIFTSAIQREGYGIRVPFEITLEDGTCIQGKYLQLTPAGMAFDLWSE